ncbi:MAG: hypothetical protein JSV03_02210, partial [Planctomycetota bacterium]
YVQDNSDEKCLTFRGFPRSGPRLIINLNDDAISTACYRSILIQMACLAQCAELMAEQRQPFSRSQGWFFYDRRLTTYDPAGHLIELVAYHQF